MATTTPKHRVQKENSGLEGNTSSHSASAAAKFSDDVIVGYSGSAAGQKSKLKKKRRRVRSSKISRVYLQSPEQALANGVYPVSGNEANSTGSSLPEEHVQISFGNFPPFSPIRVAPHCGPPFAAHIDHFAKPSVTGTSEDSTNQRLHDSAPIVRVSAAQRPQPLSPPRVDDEEEMKVAFGTFSPSPMKSEQMVSSTLEKHSTSIYDESSLSCEHTSEWNANDSGLVSKQLEIYDQHHEGFTKEYLNDEDGDATRDSEISAASNKEETSPVVTATSKTDGVIMSPEGAVNNERLELVQLATPAQALIEDLNTSTPPMQHQADSPERREPNCGFGAFLACVPCL